MALTRYAGALYIPDLKHHESNPYGIGIDSFEAMFSGNESKAISDTDAIAQLLERATRRRGFKMTGVVENGYH